MSAVSYANTDYRPSIYNYDPSVPAAFVGIFCFVIVTGAHVQLLTRYHAWHFWPMSLGLILQCAGHVARTVSILHNTNVAAFFVSYVAILLGPPFMAFACITTFDRIVWCVIPPEEHSWESLWCSTRYSHICFIVCSSTACFFQLLGACLTGNLFINMIISNGTEPTGIILLKAGLFMQVICFALFIIVGLKFAFTSRTWMTTKTQQHAIPNGADLARLHWVIQSAVLVITARTIYRLVEVFECGPGDLGAIVLEEWPLWILDILPILAVSTLLCVVHPGQHLPARFLQCYLPKKQLVKEARGTLSGFDLAKLVGTYPTIQETQHNTELSCSAPCCK